MPEGHTLHRAARLQGRRFSGHRLRVDSPQGRFVEGAAAVVGRTLDGVEAVGKHLFHRWEGGVTVHVHLGLFGRFRTFTKEAPEPTAGTRMRWRGDPGTLHLSGPTACAVIDGDEEERLLARIGPDPLAIRAGDEDRLVASFARRRVPVAQLLLDQAVVSGIGNVYRAEFCFILGLDPFTPANEVPVEIVGDIWRLAIDQMKVGERIGRIVTVDPVDAGVARHRDVPARERLFVYKRDGLPCRRCRSTIRVGSLAGRKVWWCPSCQR
ncbi:MAG: DNA-formamidopyrimidine glycosylase family protein [Ilumatobacter sp.]